MLEKFLGKVNQDPSDSKSNRLHVNIFWFCFHSFEIYSIDSSKMINNFPEVSNFNQVVFKLNQFICNQLPIPPRPEQNTLFPSISYKIRIT